MYKVEMVLSAGAELGEGPLWSARERTVYWIDIVGQTINRFDPESGSNRSVATNQLICALAACAGDGSGNDKMIGALESGLAFINPANGSFSIIKNPEAGKPTRFNDCACDRLGRLWSGTMDRGEKAPFGSLYRLGPDLELSLMDSGCIISNGIGFSPDDRTMYFSDSGRRTVFAYDFDLESGQIRNRRPLIEVPPDEGYPDGLTVDAEGSIWLAHWDGWRVTRHTDDGRTVGVIEMPVPRPTSCAFGGDALDVLYITSARTGLTPEILKQSPESGHLFAVHPGSRGLPEPEFKSSTDIG